MAILDIIRKPITAELTLFREQFDARLSHTNPLLDQVLRGVGERKGKMMRPMLTLLAAKLFSEANERTLHTACAFEYFHTASLLHDDVVDESEKRRGEASVNAAFGNKVAVLVGDYILALALEEASLAESTRLVNIISHSSQELANGELLQLHNIRNYNLSEDVYFDIIRNKTAALFSGCAEAGAMSVGAQESDLQNLYAFGDLIGLCFQIRDDIFDYNNDESIGKPTGNDMKEGKLTLPAIYALNSIAAGGTMADFDNENAPSISSEAGEMLAIARKVKDNTVTAQEVERLVAFTKEKGGIEYAQRKMAELADKAKSLLDIYPDSDTKQALCAYADFVVGRTI